MPYRVNKLKNPCTQSDGDKGMWTLTYRDSKGKFHRNCHTSEKNARAQIAAIEAPPIAAGDVSEKEVIEELREIVREIIVNELNR
jgi:hypothetical protein